MKMKKILSIALALILAIGMLAGCGGGGERTKVDLSEYEDDGSEKLTIEWLGYATLAGCEEGTATELLLEDKYNVEIKPIFAESSNYTDKKNALLQSEDVPDLIYELDPMHVYADARDEYLLEIPYQLIEQEAPDIYADINEKAPAVWAYGYYEGGNYGLPNMNHNHMESKVSTYRADWLEKVGMEVPKTVDELHDVLYAFTHDDPDGNGKNDTYGYAFASSHWQHYFAEIFGAYGILPFDWQEANGEIVYGGLKEECETVLAILAQWYKEGIIYPAFIESDKTGSELLQSNIVGYLHDMSYEDPSSDQTTLALLRQRVPEADLAYSKPIEGPDGKFGMRGWGYPCHVVSFGDNGNSPKKVTRLLNMFNDMFTDEALLLEVRYGKEGVTYTVDKDSTAVNIYNATEDYVEAAQKRLAGYEFNVAGPTFWSPICPSREVYERGLSESYKAWGEKYKSHDAVLTDAFYKVDIVPSAPTYIDDLRNGQMALMSEIVQGKKAADQYIEEFTKIWESTGGNELLEEAREQQAILDEIYVEVGIN